MTDDTLKQAEQRAQAHFNRIDKLNQTPLGIKAKELLAAGKMYPTTMRLYLMQVAELIPEQLEVEQAVLDRIEAMSIYKPWEQIGYLLGNPEDEEDETEARTRLEECETLTEMVEMLVDNLLLAISME